MVLDTSAIVAIALDEPEREAFQRAIANAHRVLVGAPTLVESRIVLTHRLGTDPTFFLDRFLAVVNAEIVAFDDAHHRASFAAWQRFGKGRHRAALNFGDCLSYAVAAVADMALLYKGSDFAQTDIAAAVSEPAIP